MKVAILDDYQNVALKLADCRSLRAGAQGGVTPTHGEPGKLHMNAHAKHTCPVNSQIFLHVLFFETASGLYPTNADAMVKPSLVTVLGGR